MKLLWINHKGNLLDASDYDSHLSFLKDRTAYSNLLKVYNLGWIAIENKSRDIDIKLKVPSRSLAAVKSMKKFVSSQSNSKYVIISTPGGYAYDALRVRVFLHRYPGDQIEDLPTDTPLPHKSKLHKKLRRDQSKSHEGECDDCAVIALACATSSSYAKAHVAANVILKRVDKKGAYANIFDFGKAIEMLGWDYKVFSGSNPPNVSPAMVALRFPEGRFLCHGRIPGVGGHAVAIVDGEVCDEDIHPTSTFLDGIMEVFPRGEEAQYA